ncbi:Oidioi.mRNA.OKI2018_I69.chr1.g519.t1.cds [Oikopleura dioica]|uniref:Oidioi.mRNA.OKI2018_I69.chr1.g519.t1.cds n=1 Tax=Oikopleura dioica TaxID=34765 RepID=A0ABN7SSA8_OIKDI|nr:Oidioi.mRNA.OKI2018_I69.chr1.g519.t1.cds [Oikopleura dioica]
MKVFSFLTISAISARRDKKEKTEGRSFFDSGESRSTEFFDCGGVTEFTKEMTSLEITSPADPNDATVYPDNTYCEWLLQDDCADSFTIKTIKFDIEGHTRCTWDYLAFATQDETFNATYCNDDNDYYSYSSSDSSEVIGFHALEEGSEVIIPGNRISITFLTDESVQHEGFQILVIPNRPEDSECSANQWEPDCIFPYNSDGSVMMKTWPLWQNLDGQTVSVDKLVPISNYAHSFEKHPDEDRDDFINRCAARCVDTPGCFKFKFIPLGQESCDLRGNKMEEPTIFAHALTGEDCPSDPANRLWRDRKATTQVFCHFSGVDDALWYLDYLRATNPQMTKWEVTPVAAHNGAVQTRKMTRRWTFSEATERPTNWGHWYTFVTTIFFRDYLVPVNATATDARKRRQTDDDEELLALANQEVQDFIANLNIGDDVEVLETEVSEIKLESLEPIEDTDTNQMVYAYSTMSELLDSTMTAEGTRRQSFKMKQFSRVIRRFSWMYEHSYDSVSCDYPTESVPHRKIDGPYDR